MTADAQHGHPTRRIGFTGSRTVDAPLTWSQQSMWIEIERARPDNGYLNAYFAVPIRAERSLCDVLDVVGRLVSVHESLRTTFDHAADGTLRQYVRRSGEFRVPLIEIPAADVAEFLPRYADEPFDHATEWPIRFSIATSGGRPACLLVVVSHLIVDGLARDLLIRDLTARLEGRDDVAEPGLTSVDLAVAEHSPRGVSRNARAVQRWRRFLETYDVTNFPRPVRPAEPRWTHTPVRSPAFGLAIARLAARNRVTTPAAYLAVSATALSVLTGRPTGVLLCMCSNRVTAAERAYVGNITQACPVAVAVGEATLDEVVRNAMTASIQGYAMARCRLDEVHAIVPPDRFDTLHNDFRVADPRSAGGYRATAPSADAIEAARARTRIGAAQALTSHTDAVYYEIQHGPDGPEPFLIVDRRRVPVDGDQLLLAMESTAVAAATQCDPQPATALFRAALDRGGSG